MNDFYALVNRYLEIFDGASVKCQDDLDPSRVNYKTTASRRNPCDLYVANGENKGVDMSRAGTATTLICRVPGLDHWPHNSVSGDNFIYSHDSSIVEALGHTTTLPPDNVRDDTDDAWSEEPEAPEEDAPFDGNSPTVW